MAKALIVAEFLLSSKVRGPYLSCVTTSTTTNFYVKVKDENNIREKIFFLFSNCCDLDLAVRFKAIRSIMNRFLFMNETTRPAVLPFNNAANVRLSL